MSIYNKHKIMVTFYIKCTHLPFDILLLYPPSHNCLVMIEDGFHSTKKQGIKITKEHQCNNKIH
jgi:hypothetical protein